jgi:hypothetical protein
LFTVDVKIAIETASPIKEIVSPVYKIQKQVDKNKANVTMTSSNNKLLLSNGTNVPKSVFNLKACPLTLLF